MCAGGGGVTPLLFTALLYAGGVASVIRANFLYIDDLGRAIEGYRGWGGASFSRYTNDFLAMFIHADKRVTDISPLPQLLGVVIMVAASVLLVYIIADKKISKFSCFLSLPLGLSPYFLECFSYKFEPPYMALSVLASIVPFLFVQNYITFSIISFLSMLIMCTTYQASSGIYCMMTAFLLFKAYNEGTKTAKELIKFAAVAALSYSLALIFFRLFLQQQAPSWTAYVSTDMAPLSQLPATVLHNLKTYIRTIKSDFGVIWKPLLLSMGIAFLITTAALTKRNKLLSLFAACAILGVLCVLSFGVYLAFPKMGFPPRYMYGFGVYIAILSVYISTCRFKIVALPAVLLCYCFFVFSLAYGNALSDQKRYNDFRTELLLRDLSALFPDIKEEPLLIRIRNSEGYAPSIQNIADKNPVIKRLVPVNLGGDWWWANYYIERYFRFNLKHDFYKTIEDNETFAVLFDSYYHTIKSDGERVLVILKP